MRVLFPYLMVLVGCSLGLRAQDLRLAATQGFGPFTNGTTRTNTFRVTNYPLRATVDSVVWRIVCQDGANGATRVVRSARTTTPFWQTDMSDLPFQPSPALNATAYYRVGTMLVSRQVASAITMQAPDIQWTATNDWAAVRVGPEFTGRFGIRGCPAGTSRLALYLRSRTGTIVDSVHRTGTSLDSATILYTTPSHPGSMVVEALVEFPGAPPGGYRMERTVQDSLHVFGIRSSNGTGPFVSGREASTTFTIDDTFGAYANAVFTFDLEGRYGTTYHIERRVVPWTRDGDRFELTMNMGDLPPYTTLRVDMQDRNGNVVSTHPVAIAIVPAENPPSFSMSRAQPLIVGVRGVDSVMIDSLPARIRRADVVVISPTGQVVAGGTRRARGNEFLRRATLRFEGSILALHRHIVRTTVWSDYSTVPNEYEFYFDVLDTTKATVIATSFGPFMQSDSSTFSAGITGIRASTVPLARRHGWFRVVDPTSRAVLMRSDTINLDGVQRSDSLWWEDQRENRVLLQAASLPIGAVVEFVDTGVRTDGTTFDNVSAHPLLMVPPPGTLTASTGYGPFTAGHSVMNTFRIDSLPTNVRSVEFTVSGTENTSAADSLLVTGITNGTAQFTTDMGQLPINARLRVTVRTLGGSERGTTLERFLYVVPDTLYMQPRLAFDTLAFAWETRSYSAVPVRSIMGPQPIENTFTFRRLPAQTERIDIVTFDALDRPIDSVAASVPYRLRFDPALTVAAPYTFRSFATARIEFRIVTTGGLEDGLVFSYPITVRNPPIEFAARRFGPSGTLDTMPLRHGGPDVLDLTARVVLPNIARYGFAENKFIDSVRIDFLDCEGNVVDRLDPGRPRSSIRTNVVASMLYPTSGLPLTTTHVALRLYSKDLTFPASGFVYKDVLRIVPFPSCAPTLDGDFPTSKVNDTTRLALDNPYSIADLPLVDSVTNIRVVDKNNIVVARYPSQVPVHDSVHFVVDMNSVAFTPWDSPYRVLAQVDYSVCSEKRSLAIDVDTFTVTRTLPMPAADYFVWSSAGWGPFRQGRSQFTQFMFGLRPGDYLGRHDLAVYGHDVRVRLRAIAPDGTTQQTFLDSLLTFPTVQSIPERLKLRSRQSQIGGLNEGTVLMATIETWRKALTGRFYLGAIDYRFPIDMIPFKPQPLVSSAGWGPFEQSVAAGGSGPTVMAKRTTLTDTSHADIVQRLDVIVRDEQGKRLDSTSMRTAAAIGTGLDRYQVSTLADYDVAQYPWPSISRDNRNVTVDVDYYFQGNAMKAASQDQRFSLTPRAPWLNGSSVMVTGSSGSLVDMTVSTPVPAAAWELNLGSVGRIPFRMGDANGQLAIVHRVTYDTATGSFRFQQADAAPSATSYAWTPTFGEFGVARLNFNVVAANGAGSDLFTAARIFDHEWPMGPRGPLGIPNRNLRLRSMIDATYSYTPTIVLSALTAMTLKAVGFKMPVLVIPTLNLDIGSQQLMIVNMGVEDGGAQMIHMGDIPSMADARRDLAVHYPTSLSSASFTDFSVGAQIALFGFFTSGLSMNYITRTTNGVAFQGPVSNITTTNFPQGGSNSMFVVLDVAAFWGVLRREVFRGHLFTNHTPHGTPAFKIYPRRFEGFFPKDGKYFLPASVPEVKAGDMHQETILAQRPLPPETPVYYSRPSIDGNDSAVAVVWTEHALRTNRGSVVLGRVNADSMTFRSEAVLAENDNAVHDPVIRLLGNDGTSLVAWNESRLDAATQSTTEFNDQSVARLLRNEDLRAAIVNGQNEVVASWTLGDDLATVEGRVDGKATMAVSKDGNRAVVAWPIQVPGDTASDVAAVVFTRQDGTWKAGATTMLTTTVGFDDLLDIMPVKADEFVLVSRTAAASSGSTIHSWHYAGAWTTGATVYTEEPGESIEAMSLDGNGDYGVMAVVTSKPVEDSIGHALTLRTYVFTTDWQKPEQQAMNGMLGTVRALDVSVDDDGIASVIMDITYPHKNETGVNDGERDTRTTYTYTKDGISEPWTSDVDSDALYESDERVWSMASTTGPGGIVYVVDQELDSSYGNLQRYRQGVQVGPARINTVLRAFRYDNDTLVSVPFGQPTVVSVVEDQIEKNLRYPSTLHDPYPNPASGEAVVPFVVLQRTHVRVDVLDVTGTVMQTLVDTDLDGGIYDAPIPTATWPQGCYTIRMITGTGQLMSKAFTVVR